MTNWSHRHAEFAAALFDGCLTVPRGVVDPQRRECPRRFGVYRNNITVALIEALESSFPAVRRLVGEEFFHEVARQYAATDPPASPVLLEYGAGFPQYLEGFEPAAALPYLPDVARIERAWLEAYHAPDATPLDLAVLARVPHERAEEIRFGLHPAARVTRSRYPALTIWRMNIADGESSPVDLDAGGEDVLVVRPAAEVVVRSMPGGGADLLEALASGEPLAAAAGSVLRTHPDLDLAGHLAGLLESGAFAAYSI